MGSFDERLHRLAVQIRDVMDQLPLENSGPVVNINISGDNKGAIHTGSGSICVQRKGDDRVKEKD